MRDEMSLDPYYQTCSRANAECQGRITWEHVWIYAGKQVNEIWAIIPLCEYHHSVNWHQDGHGLNKKINEAISLARATVEDLKKYPTKTWLLLIREAITTSEKHVIGSSSEGITSSLRKLITQFSHPEERSTKSATSSGPTASQ